MARPRGFEPDDALTAIKEAFWRGGYDATSMRDIEQATGLNKQSLYRLYGDKRGMYLKAIDHYSAHEATAAGVLLGDGEEGSRARFARLFGLVDIAVAGDRRGCFFCNASIDQAHRDARVRAAAMRGMEAMRATFEEALGAQGEAANIRQKAAGLLTAYLGLRVMVRAGFDEAALRCAVDDALAGI
ncbi:MAG: TetR/AcrR family transcriptional regulator [Alphaproteobacteria bacterium]|nr:TetR/AcrR family transcriptional regulator [Alphaproteobacteria bacterium]